MERPQWAPQGIDLTRPSVARMYDYYLGGSHNFEVDRAAARAALDIWPELPLIMRANRAFMRRAVRHAVSLGITQFLDIGSGIPTFGNVHEVARAAAPDATVVYVDNDAVAVAHSRAIVEGIPRTGVVAADIRKPEDIMGAPEVTELLDRERPVAVLMVALLHFVEDADRPAAAVAAVRDCLAPGSALIMTHASHDGGRIEKPEADKDPYKRMGNPLIMRSHDEIMPFFDGFDLVEPGLVHMTDWRPDPDAEEDPASGIGYAGFGLKR